jgi:amidase
MKRRAFLQGAGAAAAGGAAAAAGGDLPLEEASAADLARALAEGQASAAGLVAAYLERIEKLDRSGPTLRSVIELNPDALAIAEALDRERRDGRVRGPLHGLPVLVKDNIASGDRMETSAGSPALVGAGAPRDAFVVKRLREAGAVLLGKTNLSEWANIRGKRSISGWSTRGGQTRNPYALDRSPSGSSSGSGAAMAASLAALAVGTETDGSITSPSSCNGLVGIKPTVGLLSRDGIVPISFSQDTAGPMCRTVADAALLLAAMAGVDTRDPATRAQAGRIDLAALGTPRADALRGARLGIAENLIGDHVATAKRFDDTLALLRDAGAVLVKAPLPPAEKLWEPEFELLLVEMQHAMPRYLAEFAPNRPHRRHRRGTAQAAARRADRADQRPGLADRSGPRRCERGVGHVVRGGGRLSARHGADGPGGRTAGGIELLRRRVERAAPARPGALVREHRAGTPAAGLPGQRGRLISSGCTPAARRSAQRPRPASPRSATRVPARAAR